MNRFLLALAFIAVSGIAEASVAQTHPSRPITIVLPFAAGGGTDVLGQMIAQRLRASLGQPVMGLEIFPREQQTPEALRAL